MTKRQFHPGSPEDAVRMLGRAGVHMEHIVRGACGETITQDVVDEAQSVAGTITDISQALSKRGRGVEVERVLGATRWRIRKWLPRLKDRIIADLPAPGERHRTARPGELTRRFTLYMTVVRSGLVPSAEVRHTEEMLSAGITHAAVFYQRWLTDHLMLKDPVDVRAVSFDQLRMEILLWLLEEIGDEKAAANVRTQARITARAALRRARNMVEEYVARRGPAERFDVATIVAQVEELALLIERIAAFTYQEDSGDWNLAETNREAISAFVHSCGKLVLATFRDIQERLFDARLSAKTLRGALKQVEAVRNLLWRVDRSGGTVRQAVDRIISRKGELLVKLLARHDELDPQQRREMLDEIAATIQRLRAAAR